MVSLTESAINHVRQIRRESGSEGYGLRIAVQAGGCSGFTYEMSFDNSVGDGDSVFENADVKVLVDPLSLQYLDGTQVDYVQKSSYEGGFQFDNPHVTSSCGCGKSFSAD